jgi:hypothetical protein
MVLILFQLMGCTQQPAVITKAAKAPEHTKREETPTITPQINYARMIGKFVVMLLGTCLFIYLLHWRTLQPAAPVALKDEPKIELQNTEDENADPNGNGVPLTASQLCDAVNACYSHIAAEQ